MFEENEFSLAPINFLQVRTRCPRLPTSESFPSLETVRKIDPYLLPDLTDYCGDESFASLAMGWSPEGLEFQVAVQSPIEKVYFPEVEKGDSIELFIDTRDVKTAGTNNRFCHHFFFLPEAIDGRQAGEMTKFRTEDKHDWCDPNELQIKVKKNAKGYIAKIFIPAQCLHGYDPEQCSSIGFTYRINRYGELPQHYSVDSEDYSLEQQPALWSSITLAQ
jgi:hypothetical protein